MMTTLSRRKKFTPVGTYLLIASLLIFHVISLYLGIKTVRMLDFVAAQPFQMAGLTFLTATFLHSSWLHVLINSFAIYVYGVHVEHRIGSFGMLLVFLVGGFCGHFAYELIAPASILHSRGASGGAFGLIAFYSFSYPRDPMNDMMKRLHLDIPIPQRGLLFNWRWIREYKAPAIQVFGIYLLWVVVGLGLQLANLTKTNSAAHLGGAMSGVVCYWLFRNKSIWKFRISNRRDEPSNA